MSSNLMVLGEVSFFSSAKFARFTVQCCAVKSVRKIRIFRILNPAKLMLAKKRDGKSNDD